MSTSNCSENNHLDLKMQTHINNDHHNKVNYPTQNITNAGTILKKEKSIVRMRFTPQEDEEILRLVSIFGDRAWDKISSELSKISNNIIQKTPRQLRDRYVNYLNPNINKAEWTLEEDQCLIHNFMLSQPHFKSMRQFFPGRSEVAIKNRFKYLYKYGLGLLKSNINKDLQQKGNIQGNNMNDILNNSNINTKQFIDKFNINFGSIYSKHVKSIVLDIFHNCPTVLVQDNHLIFNKESSQKIQGDDSTEENENKNEEFQSESDIDPFDPIYWFDMFQ